MIAVALKLVGSVRLFLFLLHSQKFLDVRAPANLVRKGLAVITFFSIRRL